MEAATIKVLPDTLARVGIHGQQIPALRTRELLTMWMHNPNVYTPRGFVEHDALNGPRSPIC